MKAVAIVLGVLMVAAACVSAEPTYRFEDPESERSVYYKAILKEETKEVTDTVRFNLAQKEDELASAEEAVVSAQERVVEIKAEISAIKTALGIIE